MLSICGGNVALNNMRLDKFSGQLFNYSLPEGAIIISQESKVGVLTGMGNHCDFIATMTIKGSLNIEKVKEHYAELKINPAVGESDAEQHLEIEQLSKDEISIRIIDAPNMRWFDPRCT
jgi:hypothetical protein